MSTIFSNPLSGSERLLARVAEDQYTPNEQAVQQALEVCNEIVHASNAHQLSPTKGLYLHGASDICRTSLLNEIAQLLDTNHVPFISIDELTLIHQVTRGSSYTIAVPEEYLIPFQTTPVLILHDFSDELFHLCNDNNTYGLQRISSSVAKIFSAYTQIFRFRSSHALPTFITASRSHKHLREHDNYVHLRASDFSAIRHYIDKCIASIDSLFRFHELSSSSECLPTHLEIPCVPITNYSISLPETNGNHRFTNAERNVLFQRSGLPNEAHAHTFANPDTENNKAVYRNARALCQKALKTHSPCGMYIHGYPKAANTRLLHCVANEAIRLGNEVLYANETSLFHVIHTAKIDPLSFVETALLPYKTVPVLVLEELDSLLCPSLYTNDADDIKNEPRYSKLSILQDIIEYRQNTARLTVIASEHLFDPETIRYFDNLCTNTDCSSFDGDFWGHIKSHYIIMQPYS